MNNLEKSLCATCEHLVYCSLTSNKKSIWSCSEYDITIGHHKVYHDRMMKPSNDSSASYRNLEIT